MTTETQTFNARALLRQVIETTTASRSADIAEEVLVAIPAEHYEDALRQILPAVVTQAMSTLRTRHPIEIEEETLHPRRRATPSENSANSAKNKSIKTWVQRKLADLICVDEHSGARKPLGDCTFEDLMAAASLRYDQASRLMANAAEFESYAKLLKEHGVTQFKQLPEDALEQVLRD